MGRDPSFSTGVAPRSAGAEIQNSVKFCTPADRILYVQSFIDLSIAVSEPEGIENVDIIRSIASGA